MMCVYRSCSLKRLLSHMDFPYSVQLHVSKRRGKLLWYQV
jgi:hypothetical protein